MFCILLEVYFPEMSQLWCLFICLVLPCYLWQWPFFVQGQLSKEALLCHAISKLQEETSNIDTNFLHQIKTAFVVYKNSHEVESLW